MTPAAGGTRLINELTAARRAVPPPAPDDLAAGRREPGRAYRARLAELTEAALVDLWAAAGHHLGLDTDHGLAIACVGSIARRDGGPHADLDLLLLHDGSIPDWDLDDLDRILRTTVRAAGHRLDRSVLTVSDCRAVASTDVAASVGMVGMRHIAGDPALTADAAAAVLQDWRGASRARVADLEGAVTSRERRRGILAELTEPDLKESRGGLRDVRIVVALAAARLAPPPPQEVDDAAAHLADVRDALHRVTGTAGNVLRTRHQQVVTAELGRPGAPDALLAEVARSGAEVRAHLDAALAAAHEATRPRHRLAERLHLTRREPGDRR